MDGELASSPRTRYDLHLNLDAAYETREHSRGSHSQAPHSVLVSSSPISLSSPIISSPSDRPPAVSKAQGELRKLLAHLLSGLKARPLAPSVHDNIRTDSAGKESHRLREIVETVKSAVRYNLPKELLDPEYVAGEEDDGVNNVQDYSTDVTYDLMTQLRDVLIVSTKQGWQIFEPVVVEASMSQRENSSLRRLRRNSRQLGQGSRSPFLSASSRPSDLLQECINILASVISEDCRFRMSSSRVFLPPYSLQSVTLDVSLSLVNMHRHDAKIRSRIGFALIPAFSSFSPSLHTRLFSFFEDGIIRGMLADLRSWQGLDGIATEDETSDELPVTKTPVVAIQVEEPRDDSSPLTGQPGWLQWSSASTPINSIYLSTVAPSQPLVIYHLSSLIPPLLAAVLECVDPFEDDIKDVPRFYRFHTLLRTILSMKCDAYLDILEIVAYHGPQTRRRALAVLATFWPKSLGHTVIGRSLPIISLADSLPNQTPSLRLQYAVPHRDHPYAHEFVPWRFSVQDSSSALDYGITQSSCQSCCNVIAGFGLFCPFCLTAVHLNCYDTSDGTFHGQYFTTSESDHRQCFVSFSNTLPTRRDAEPEIFAKGDHAFRVANLFTLALCLVCRKPLWGYVKQGMKCSTCLQFVHSSCLSSTSPDAFPSCRDFVLTASHVTIDWAVLRGTFVDHYKELLIDENLLSARSYEEVSIFYSILWAQLCIVENGVVYKSIVVKQLNPRTPSGKENQVDEFELQYFVRLYEAFLSSGRLHMSYALQEYYEISKNIPSNENSILYDWPLLTSIAAIIKTPLSTHKPSVPPSSNLLQANERDVYEALDSPSYPSELVPLSQMRKVLGIEFHVNSERAINYILSHISLIGFFHKTDLKGGLYDDPMLCEGSYCFPLPSGLELSTSVETLVVAIDACLRDMDISINEHGFLLLVRRFWPTGAASDYALRRLTKIVLSWALAEDDRLVAIAHDRIGLNYGLPGVRTPSETPPWPSTSRYGSKRSARSGGEYVMCRKQLLVRHALPWLTALHELDVQLYANCLYDHSVDIADALEPNQTIDSLCPSTGRLKAQAAANAAWGEAVLRSIIKLAQLNITFSRFRAILTRWFDSIAAPGTPAHSIVFRSLPRLFAHDGEASRRTSVTNDPSLGIADPVYVDPWKMLNMMASEDIKGLERSISWLRVMAHSAVDIPTETLKNTFKLTRDFRVSFQTIVSLLGSTMTFMWIKTFGSNEIDLLVVEINDVWADELLRRMKSDEDIELVHDFIRYSLVSCLLIYGCERQAIISLGLIRPEEINSLPQRRRTGRTSLVPTALEIDPKLVAILSRYVSEGPDSVCTLVAKFLNTLVSESALLEAHEIDRFIHVNGDALSKCAWRFYDLKVQDLDDIHTSFLSRILVVDPQPFNSLLHDILQTGGKWQVRFQAVSRLFRIVLDVTSPSFGVEGRQWMSNVTDVINHFFGALWMDDREEIRSAVDTWARTLLPAHLQVISSCWNECMTKSPMVDRARLSAFLVQLHPHFPSWNLISWETIVEVLLSHDLLRKNEGNEDDAASAHLSVLVFTSSGEPSQTLQNDKPDIIALQVSLVLLSLQMIADGISIDLVHLVKIKLILAKIFGFNSTLYPTDNGRAFYVQLESLDEMHQSSFSCISPLMRVLDAPHTLSLSPSSMGVTWNELPVASLVGDVFIDIVGGLWEKIENVQTLPYSVLRGLLECMLLVIVKHDLGSPVLKHLEDVICRAVKRVADLVASDFSYDLRCLCLSVMRAHMHDYPVLALKILGHQVLVLTRLTASLHFNTDDPLVHQAKSFVEAAFVQYEVSGLFWLLSKQGSMSNDFFLMLRAVVNGTEAIVSGETLRDSIVKDTLSKIAANTNDRAVPDVLYNLENYVDMCHHQAFSPSLIQHIGLRLTAIARQAGELPSSSANRSMQGFDPNPLLMMSATIVQHNKELSTDLVLHIETLLRIALIRFEVRLETVNRVLHVVSTVQRRSEFEDVSGTEPLVNAVTAGVLEILSDSLKGKIRVLPSTMNAMLEAVMLLHINQSTHIRTPSIVRIGVDSVSYLTYPIYRETYGETEFVATLAVAKLVLHVSNYDESILSQTLAGGSRTPLPIRVWNLVTLAALKRPDSDASSKLLTLLHSFVLAYIVSLRRPLSGLLDESVASEVNHAFASIKLWMLVARKSYHENVIGNLALDADAAERTVWNELWPSFERLVFSLADGPNEDAPPLMTFLWGCVSDLMLFVRQARSVVALDTSSHASILNKLRASSRVESAGGKFGRALRSISESPPDLPFDALVTQVTGDVLAAERLQAIEVYKQGGAEKRREHADKRRGETREFRTTS